MAFLASLALGAAADNLVILHTNDTHSQIDPDDKDHLGGVLRRKAVIDSVRAAQPNVLLIDAGDVVQGTLFFNLYGGEVEQKVMNALGYDIRILGNHEFDNGVDSLAAVLAAAKSEFLATNYDLSSSPLAHKFKKYDIRTVGDRRIGFIAINLEPKGMISEGNYDGVVYRDAIEAANASAWWLKNVEGCDLVVAVTHIGYDPAVPPGDINLAENTRNIDIIIGGHSHDLIHPNAESSKYRWHVTNADGHSVLIAQVGKAGKAVGEITIDLDELTAVSRVIRIDSRLDREFDQALAEIIEPYRQGVDSLMRVPVGKSKIELSQSSPALLNWVSDVVYDRGTQLADDVDFAIVNKGGIRRGLPKGTVTEGQIMTMLPFNNHVVVIDIKGADLLEAFEQMARVEGNGVSRGIEMDFYPGTDSLDHRDARVLKVTLAGKPLDPDHTYRVATIDYLAGGGDYMPSLKHHTFITASPLKLYDDVLAYLRTGAGRRKAINPPTSPRMHSKND